MLYVFILDGASYHMEGIGDKSKGMDRITCFLSVSLDLRILSNSNDEPAMSSNRKKAVSITSRIMILLVLESAMAIVLRRARWREDPQQEKRLTAATIGE